MKRNILGIVLTALAFATLPLAASGCFETEAPMCSSVGDGGVGAFQPLYDQPIFQMCSDCHAPGAPGITTGTEATQNWTSSTTAFTTLKGNASGLVGNFAGCNGVPLVGPTSSQSLLVAIFDPTVRATFSYPGHPTCTGDAITDETLRVGAIPPSVLAQLKEFIDCGGFR